MIINNIKIILAILYLTNTAAFAQQEPKLRQSKQYNLEQATSERAQLHTVAFSGLAFMTGNFGADTFFPPGKVADFFGFQYMRDNDKNEKGHNTDFLTSIANSVLSVLTTEQLAELKQLAKQQAPVYDAFAYKRFELIRAFRDFMEKGKEPEIAFIKKTGAELYTMDAELSYGRAIVVGKIIQSFTAEQKASLAKFQFDNSSTWQNIPEQLDKRSLSHREHVCVMTYLSELFSWYAGSVEADVYFCPERHGTYFGGFYMKDFPAMGNPDYNISTALTGDSGRDFIASLKPEQASLINESMLKQAPLLQQIVEIRKTVVLELRKSISGQLPDKKLVYSSIQKYGELDAEMSFYMAQAFTQIYKTLTPEQKQQLLTIRNQSVLPKGAYLYSDPIEITK
ncbi:MAG: Spy/CpxP family protein refolding chaperone [Paludibacter sp.]